MGDKNLKENHFYHPSSSAGLSSELLDCDKLISSPSSPRGYFFDDSLPFLNDIVKTVPSN